MTNNVMTNNTNNNNNNNNVGPTTQLENNYFIKQVF